MRTGTMRNDVEVAAGTRVSLVAEEVRGSADRIPITPAFAISKLAPGSRVSVDFDSVLLRIDAVRDGEAEATALRGGAVGTRKAVTAFPTVRLPSFSEKDLLAIRTGLLNGVQEFALSFCEQPSSLHELRQMVGPASIVMAKIESRKGVRNLAKIAQLADRLIIDRGDLSREVRIEAIPLLQKAIIRKANALGVPVYVATNLLESMVTQRTPSRAEVNDVINTLLDGADGLVLASETAIGRYPVEATRMIVSLMNEFEVSAGGSRINDLLGDHPLRLPYRP